MPKSIWERLPFQGLWKSFSNQAMFTNPGNSKYLMEQENI